MEFTDWQLDRLRRALNSYRIANARNGRLMPWKAVIDNILASEVTAYQHPKSGSEPEFREEALRRFAVGTSTLEPDKLEDLKSFLIAEKMLGPKELDSDPAELHELLTVRACLAATSEGARRYLSQLAPDQVATFKTSGGDKCFVRLHMVADASGTFMRVEEEVGVSTQDALRLGASKKDDRFVESQRRKGYAFASCPELHLHIFLRGAANEDRATYLGLRFSNSLFAPAGDAELCLMRTGVEGAFVRDPMTGVRQFTGNNILQFRLPGRERESPLAKYRGVLQ